MHKLVLFEDGGVSGFGDMRDGQLGPRAGIANYRGHSTALVPIGLPGKAVDVAAGYRTSYVLLENGMVVAFGFGMNGELGTGEGGLAGTERPVAVGGLRDVVRIAAAPKSAFAVHRDGTVSAWGSREGGVIGEKRPPGGAPAGMALSPVKVPGVGAIASLSASNTHVLAVTGQGKVWSWGGEGAPTGRPANPDGGWMEPGEVPGLSDVDTVVATGISAVLKKDGSVWVWGNNGQAQLGNGRRTAGEEVSVPQRVMGVNGAVQLAGALVGRHFLALLRDGTLRAWGNSDWGQIGNGVFGREQAAVATPKIAGVAKVFAAGNLTIAVGKDGTHWVWGAPNFQGPVWPITKDTVLPIKVSFEGGK